MGRRHQKLLKAPGSGDYRPSLMVRKNAPEGFFIFRKKIDKPQGDHYTLKH
jgi:hypothetical protein